MSADYQYPIDGKCYGHADPTLWDLAVEGETVAQKHARHEEAKRICGTCPVTEQCLRHRDPTRDEGVRGGLVFGLPKWGYGGYGSVEGVVRKAWKRKAS